MYNLKMDKLLLNVKKLLFFMYVITFYIFGASTETVIYSEIILVLFCGLEAIEIIKNKKIFINKHTMGLFIFCVFSLISSFWAINSDLSLDRSITLIILFAFLAISYNLFKCVKNSEDILLKMIMWAGIILSGYILLYYGLANCIKMLIEGQRIGEDINNVNAIGMQTSISFIIAMFYGIYYRKKRYIFLGILPLFISLFTGSRKAILVILLGCILLLLLESSKKFKIKDILKKVILIIVVVFGIIALLQLPMFSMLNNRITGLINAFTNTGKVDNSTQIRMNLIKAGLKSFLEHPILGIGIGNSGYIALEVENWFTYLHNNYVELLSTVGIIGFCSYYYIYIYIIIKCFQYRKSECKYVNILLVIFVLNLILDYGVVSYYTKTTYIYILLGMVILENVRKKENEKNNKMSEESTENRIVLDE